MWSSRRTPVPTFFRGSSGASLIDVGDADRFTEFELAGVRLFLTTIIRKAWICRPRSGRQRLRSRRGAGKAQPVEEQPVPVTLDQLFHVKHIAPEPGTGRDVDLLEIELAAALGLRGQLLVASQPRPVLGLPRLRVGPCPLQLALQDLGTLGIPATLDLEPAFLVSR